MQKYDLTVMLPASLDAAGQKKWNDKVEKLVSAVGGKTEKMVDMGRKQLAFKVGKAGEAAYLNWTLELPSDGVIQLDKKLTVDQEVLRHLLVREDNDK